jgi:hypothetical protein
VWKQRRLGRVRDLEPSSLTFPRGSDLALAVVGRQAGAPFTTCLAVLLRPLLELEEPVYARCGPAGPFLRDYVARYGHAKLRPRDALGAVADIFS